MISQSILNQPMRRPVAILAIIATADLAITLLGLITGQIGELNPMLNWALIRGGIMGFLAVKSAFIFFPTLGFVWIGTKEPKIADLFAWWAVGLYLVIFAVGIFAQVAP